jgi:hypothetical protein
MCVCVCVCVCVREFIKINDLNLSTEYACYYVDVDIMLYVQLLESTRRGP